LFVTGAGGTPGQPDLHYALIQEPPGAGTQAIISSIVPSSWVVPANSSWLSVDNNANSSQPLGVYIFRLTFPLESAAHTPLDPATAIINGTFTADDTCSILINGLVVANSPNDPNNPNFASLAPFSITNGFVAGVNTLDFFVQNFGTQINPMGVLVDAISGTAV